MDKKLIILNDICSEVSKLGKKHLQKLMYLMERYGINLNLNYSIHFFGPYSAKLDNWLHEYESNGTLTIDTSEQTHTISLNEEIDDSLEGEDYNREKFVLEKYKSFSALDLEALTTIDYVAHTVYKDKKNKSQVIEMVKLIKGSKFSGEELSKKYDILLKNGLIAS